MYLDASDYVQGELSKLVLRAHFADFAVEFFAEGDRKFGERHHNVARFVDMSNHMTGEDTEAECHQKRDALEPIIERLRHQTHV